MTVEKVFKATTGKSYEILEYLLEKNMPFPTFFKPITKEESKLSLLSPISGPIVFTLLAPVFLAASLTIAIKSLRSTNSSEERKKALTIFFKAGVTCLLLAIPSALINLVDVIGRLFSSCSNQANENTYPQQLGAYQR